MAAQVLVIQGEVRNARSHDVSPFAKVVLSSARTTVGTQYTDQHGRFRFPALPDDAYYLLSVDHPSYRTTELDGAALLVAPASALQIDLVPAKSEMPGSAAAVPVAELMMPKGARKEFDRARTYVKSGRFDLAEKSFLKAALLSDAPEITVSFADMYARQKRYNEAQKVLIESLRRYPDFGDLYYALATIYFEEGRHDEAEELGKQAHARKHSIADVHLLLAKLHLGKQELKAVAEQLEIYLREAPRSPISRQVKQDLEKFRSNRVE